MDNHKIVKLKDSDIYLPKNTFTNFNVNNVAHVEHMWTLQPSNNRKIFLKKVEQDHQQMPRPKSKD